MRTVTAFREDGRTVVAIPSRFTRTQEREWVKRMVTRLARQEMRRRPSDAKLHTRARELSQRYLGGRAQPTSITWSTQQGRRWGSCSLADGTIRISTRVQGMPGWVLDYVILHELAHLLHGGHGTEFWALLEAYPRTERARGFLDGVSFATQMGLAEEGENGAEDDLADEDGPEAEASAAGSPAEATSGADAHGRGAVDASSHEAVAADDEA